MAVKLGNSNSSGFLEPWTTPINKTANLYTGYTTIFTGLASAFAIYKNPKNAMVCCSAAGAFVGSAIAWYKEASWTNQIASTFAGASVGALAAKFFPETVGKVHQTVMGFFGVTFEASTESSAEVVEKALDQVGETQASGNKASGNEASTESSAGVGEKALDQVGETQASGNEASGNEASTESSAGVGEKALDQVGETQVSGNEVSGNEVSGNAVSGNAVSGNEVSGNAVSGDETNETFGINQGYEHVGFEFEGDVEE